MAQTIIASDIILLVSFVLEQSIAFCRSGVVTLGRYRSNACPRRWMSISMWDSYVAFPASLLALERSRFWKISGSRCSEVFGIAHGPP